MTIGKKAKITLVGLLALGVIAGGGWLALQFMGRTGSRMLGKDHRQVLKVEHYKSFVSISYDKRGGSTVKDVTYIATDGYVYTREFRDVSPLEGVIRWVPHGQSSSFIQSRGISRWGGGVIDLELPKDCKKVLGVDITYASEDERVKNLTYLSTDGRIYSKEYLEGLLERQFGGWLEIRPVK